MKSLNLQFFGGRGSSSSSSNNSENDALEAYVSGDMMWINQYFRGRGDFGDLTNDEKAFIKDMDRALNHNLGEEKLYRSVDASAIFGNADMYDLLQFMQYGENASLTKDSMKKMKNVLDSGIGKEITEKGYMSTTRDKEIAQDWGDFTGSTNPIVIDFEKKKSLKGKRMTRFEVSGDEQKEVLLKRNTRYKTTGFYVENGIVHVKAKFI